MIEEATASTPWIDVVDDRLLVDQHREGLPHLRARKQRVLGIEVDIGHAEARL